MILANDHLSLQTRFSPTTNSQIKLEPSSSTSSSASPASDSDDTTNVSSPIRQSTSTQDIMSISPKSEILHTGMVGESSGGGGCGNGSPGQNCGNSNINEKLLNIPSSINNNNNKLTSSTINTPTMDFNLLFNTINNTKDQLFIDKNNFNKDDNGGGGKMVEKGITSLSVNNLHDIIPKLPSTIGLDNIHGNNFINTFTQGDPNAILQLSQLLTNSSNTNLFTGTNFPNFTGQLNNNNTTNNNIHNSSKRLTQDCLSSSNNIQQQLSSSSSVNNNNENKRRNAPYTFQYCVLCRKNVHSSKLPCHIRQCHVAKPMFRCPSCDFTSTYSKNNVKSHMVSLHGLAGDPISYMDQYSSQVDEYMKKCFPNVRGRGRPVHGRHSPKSPQTKKQHIQSQVNLLSDQGNGVNQLNAAAAAAAVAANISGQMNQFNMIYNPLFNKNINPNFAPTLTSQNRFNNPQIATSVNQLNPQPFPQHAPPPPPPGGWGNLQLINGNDNKNYPQVMMQSNPLNIFPYLNSTMTKSETSSSINHNNNNNNNIHDGQKIDIPSTISENNNIKKDKYDNATPTTSLFNISNVSEFLSNLKNLSSGSDNNNCVGGTTEFDEELKIQTNEIKMKGIIMDNDLLKSKYFGLYPYNTLCLLDNDYIKNTVFEVSINDYNNISEMIKKSRLDIIYQQKNQEERLLSTEDQSKIDEIKKKLKAQPFEILFALHKYDISVLTPQDISLIFSIAPTSIDIIKIKKMMENNKLSLSEAESFISQLASIENLPKKIYIMNFIFNRFDRLSLDAINNYRKISRLVTNLSQNDALNELFKIILMILNAMYFGDCTNCQLANNNNDKSNINEGNLSMIKGFTFETLEELFITKRDENLSDKGDDVKFNDTLKNIINNIFIEKVKNEDVKELFDIINDILNFNFDENDKILSIIEGSFQVLEDERHLMSDKSKEIVSKFIETSYKNINDIKVEKLKAKNTIDNCIMYYCASMSYGTTTSTIKTFFSKLNEILENLIKAF